MNQTSRSFRAVAAALIAAPAARHHAYNLSRAAGIRSAATFRVLDQLLAAGWATDHWETPTEAVGREPRRYYVLTDTGRTEATHLLNTPPTKQPLIHRLRHPGQ